jgi:hypothetical protein
VQLSAQPWFGPEDRPYGVRTSGVFGAESCGLVLVPVKSNPAPVPMEDEVVRREEVILGRGRGGRRGE